jgi:[citrate (pro-3S)-lyase] ligase
VVFTGKNSQVMTLIRKPVGHTLRVRYEAIVENAVLHLSLWSDESKTYTVTFGLFCDNVPIPTDVSAMSLTASYRLNASFPLLKLGCFVVKICFYSDSIEKPIFTFLTDHLYFTSSLAFTFVNPQGSDYKAGLARIIELVDADTKDAWQAKVEELLVWGGTSLLGSWLAQRRINHISLYTTPSNWWLARPFCLALTHDRRIQVAHYFTNEVFRPSFLLKQTSAPEFVPLDQTTIDKDDTLLALTIETDSTLEKKFGTAWGGRIIQWKELFAELCKYAYYQVPLQDFLQKHPDISVLGFDYPVFPKKCRTSNEENLADRQVSLTAVRAAINQTKPQLITKGFDGLGYNFEEIAEMLSEYPSYMDEYGVRQFSNRVGNLVNFSAGHRVTTNVPDDYERTIHIFGGCKVFGVGVPDHLTLASQLQLLFNRHHPTLKVRVVNYGGFFALNNSEIYPLLNSIQYNSGDVVLFISPPFEAQGYSYCNLRLAFQRPHDYGEIYIDRTHPNERGQAVVAQQLFDEILNKRLLEQTCVAVTKSPPPFESSHSLLPSKLQEELETYKETLREFGVFSQGVCGAIVMNCNPFTLGHLYLAEYAAKQVDQLYLFVVQEDKSFFPFSDRIELVRCGVAHLGNVTVIPSGMFIISSLTFTDYFNKAEKQDRVIDSSVDVTIFATEIAPTLHITIRFAGDEPLDKITQQYNHTMRDILPHYGIEFRVIPRLLSDRQPISASRVRQLLEQKDFESIGEIVPPTTLNYLREKYA